MIKIKFGIFLEIDIKPPEIELKGKKGKGGQGASKDKAKESKKAKEKVVPTAKPKDEVIEQPKYLINVEAPITYFHIQYVLLPKHLPYNIDIIVWDKIVKIFTSDGDVIYRPSLKGTKIWIPIMLEHKFPEMEMEEVENLFSHIIDCTFSENKVKLCNRAFNETRKHFFIKKQDIDTNTLVEAYEEDPNSELAINTVIEHLETSVTNPIITKLFVFENSLLFPMFKKIQHKNENGLEVACKDYIPNSPEPIDEIISEEDDDNVNQIDWASKEQIKEGKGGKGKGDKGKEKKKKDKGSDKKDKKDKKGKTDKGNKVMDCVIKISGETFFTDPSCCSYDLKQPSGRLLKGYVTLQTLNLLTREQQQELNPLVIRLKNVINLPVDVLRREKINSVYLQYNIPSIARTTTVEKPIKSKVIFNESHAYIKLPIDILIPYLQTNLFLVELVGTRTERELLPVIFGKGPCDGKTEEIDADKLLDEEPKNIVLAVAAFDLSWLLRESYNLVMKNSFRHPNHLLCQSIVSPYENIKYTRVLTINDINLRTRTKTSHTSPLTDAILLDHDTCLKVEISTTIPIYGLSHLLANTRVFKRLCLIIFDKEVAIVILNELLLFNQNIMAEVVVPNYFLVNKETDFGSSDMVTGVVIDNLESYLFLFESHTQCYVLEMIWSQVKNLNQSVCKIFYNSEHIFSKRIYENYIAIGGIGKIILKIPFQDIVAIGDVYLEHNLPSPCYKAIRKLDLLFNTQTMNEISKYNLFPSASEIMSFNMEFGVAYHLINRNISL